MQAHVDTFHLCCSHIGVIQFENQMSRENSLEGEKDQIVCLEKQHKAEETPKKSKYCQDIIIFSERI